MERGRGRAGSGGLCRSESGGGDSFAGAGGEAGFLTHCGTGGAGAGRGWGLGLPRAPAICSGGKGHPLGQGSSSGLSEQPVLISAGALGGAPHSHCLFISTSAPRRLR